MLIVPNCVIPAGMTGAVGAVLIVPVLDVFGGWVPTNVPGKIPT